MLWALAYFRQIYTGGLLVEALHLAWSRDGVRFLALNGNEPTFRSPTGGIRDPFIHRGHDGLFHLLATHCGHRDSLFHAVSPDLVDWEVRPALPVMRQVADTQNCWAPEVVFDPARADYLVFWSSSHSGEAAWEDNRIWCARTRDFVDFSTPRVLFDPGYSVIDASIVEHGGRYYMFFKEERFDCERIGLQCGERRRIHLAVADNLEGPYTMRPDPVTPTITEGPMAVHMPEQDRWHLYYDYPWADGYGLSTSTDLETWHIHPEASFPPNTRHGSIFPITDGEAARLSAHFGE